MGLRVNLVNLGEPPSERGSPSISRLLVILYGVRVNLVNLSLREIYSIRAAKARKRLYYFEITAVEPAESPESTPTDPAACESPPPPDPIGADGVVALAEESPASAGPSPTPATPPGDAGPVAGPDPPAVGDPEWV